MFYSATQLKSLCGSPSRSPNHTGLGWACATALIAHCKDQVSGINLDSRNTENGLKISKEQQDEPKTAMKALPGFVRAASLGEELKKKCSVKTFWQAWKPLRPKSGFAVCRVSAKGMQALEFWMEIFTIAYEATLYLLLASGY